MSNFVAMVPARNREDRGSILAGPASQFGFWTRFPVNSRKAANSGAFFLFGPRLRTRFPETAAGDTGSLATLRRRRQSDSVH
jgi:hypothetical protein